MGGARTLDLRSPSPPRSGLEDRGRLRISERHAVPAELRRVCGHQRDVHLHGGLLSGRALGSDRLRVLVRRRLLLGGLLLITLALGIFTRKLHLGFMLWDKSAGDALYAVAV